MTGVTKILNAIERGDSKAAEELLPLVYDELRLLAAQKIAQEQFHKRQRTDNSIQLPAL